MAGSSGAAAGAAVAAAVIVEEEQQRERIAIDLHHTLNPLVEGTSKQGEVCTAVSGNGILSEKMSRTVNGQTTTVDFSRSLLDNDTAKGSILPNVNIETKIKEPLFSDDTVTSTLTDPTDHNKVLETRESTIGNNLFSPDTIDTKIFDADHKLKGTIHSDLSGFWGYSNIDTVVKDAAGHELRKLQSAYDGNLTVPDTLCTHLK